MRAKLLIAAAALVILSLVTAIPCGAAASGKSLFEELGFPEPPGARLLTEINLPQNRVADLEREYASRLGLRSMDRVSMEEYSISTSDDAQDILRLYEPYLQKQNWSTISRVINQGVGVAIVTHEKHGVLIVIVDTGRDHTMTLLLIAGDLDPSRKIDTGKVDDIFKALDSRIPVGRPVSVPPSEKLHIKATRSDLRARLLSQNTTELRTTSRENPGELSRIDDRLVFDLTPRLAVDEIDLPANVALLIELTDGSLNLTGNSGAKPLRLSVVSTSAPVTMNGVPLVSGTHSIKSVNGEVKASLSPVEGGVFGVEVTGANVTLIVPRDASAMVKASTTSGSKIDNQTNVTPEESSDSSISLKMGAGKAEISLRAVNGTVCIKYAD